MSTDPRDLLDAQRKRRDAHARHLERLKANTSPDGRISDLGAARVDAIAATMQLTEDEAAQLAAFHREFPEESLERQATWLLAQRQPDDPSAA
jgi:hypothetical protein